MWYRISSKTYILNVSGLPFYFYIFTFKSKEFFYIDRASDYPQTQLNNKSDFIL